MSASTFAICFDLVLRSLSCLAGPGLRVFAYADDTALVVKHLWSIIDRIAVLLLEVGLATNLWINGQKTFLVSLNFSPCL